MMIYNHTYVTNISLLSYFESQASSQKPLEQSDLLSQGVTAVVHGSSQFVHWAAIWVMVEVSYEQPRGLPKARGNTPDFLVEHFIVQFVAKKDKNPPQTQTLKQNADWLRITITGLMRNPTGSTLPQFTHIMLDTLCTPCDTYIPFSRKYIQNSFAIRTRLTCVC